MVRSTLPLCAVSLAVSLYGAGPAREGDDFESRIRPLLVRNCYACHTSSRLGGLQLDSREHLLKGGNSGPGIVPGKPEESLLIQAVRRTHEHLKMPPQAALKPEEVAALESWVRGGAIWPDAVPSAIPEPRAFWSFQAVRKPDVPKIKDTAWARTPIDSFILEKLEARGLKPAQLAGKRTLIRRVTFDLIGLPPTPEEVDAFVADTSPDAYAKVIDRLLASRHYGERWGRHWLDLARYADGKLGAFNDEKAPNTFRYRDWVVNAFNDDMPYDVFVKAQIAGDLLPAGEREKAIGGLGFQALGRNADDQLDVTTRTLLGLTVGCAQCHNHKYDPIPTKDYYSLVGVFRSSPVSEYPLAPADVVASYKQHEKKIEVAKDEIDEFMRKQTGLLCDILAARTSDFLMAAWEVLGPAGEDVKAAAEQHKLDRETLDRWIRYLRIPERQHPYLKDWDALLARGASVQEVREFARKTQENLLAIIAEKKAVDDRNYVTLGGAAGLKDEARRTNTTIEFLDVDKYYFWRDLCSDNYRKNITDFSGGVYYYNEKQIGRFLGPAWREYLDGKRAELAALKKTLPEKYPAYDVLKDAAKPRNVRVAIRGEAKNLGEEAPRRFLAVLCDGECIPFTDGSGRLELAEAIANTRNPLTARVMVNRVWELHFGQGLVRTPSNFGKLGDAPSHPELLDWLAARFMENGWSVKKLHREILLSSAYRMSSEHSMESFRQDPENRLLWRANVQSRLDAEALRDAVLAVSGMLDASVGGPAAPLDDSNLRRTLYGYVSRSRPDATLTMFDFPDPNNTSEHRLVTNSPLQGLFFLNSTFIARAADALAKRICDGQASGDENHIRRAYLLLYNRPPQPAEVQLGLDFLRKRTWPQYAQVLLAAGEFSSVN
jgi:hypothetical protein